MSRCGNDRIKGCGAEIDWGVLPDGRKIPLHRGAGGLALYRVIAYDSVTKAYAIEPVVPGAVRAGHHRLCPEVGNFTRKPPASRPSGRDAASGD